VEKKSEKHSQVVERRYTTPNNVVEPLNMTSTTQTTEIQTIYSSSPPNISSKIITETINITGQISSKDNRAKSPLRTHSEPSVALDKSITDEKRTVSFPVEVTSKSPSSNGVDGTLEIDTDSQNETSVESKTPRGTPNRSFTTPITKPRPNSLTALTDEQNKNVPVPQRSATTAGKAKKNISLIENRRKEGRLKRRNTFNAIGLGGDIALDEETQKMAENVKRRLSKRRTRENKDELDEGVMIGTRIGEDHVNYVLMYNMLTGIRVGVSL
jgi:hypothetical protein